jgi:hypothetical protein
MLEIKRIAVALLLALLAGCGNGSEPSGPQYDFTLKGSVLLPAPLAGARLDVYRLGSGGHEKRLGGGVAGDQGAFSVDLVGIREGDLLLVRASGAEAWWHDAAFDSERHLGEGHTLEAAFLFDVSAQDEVLVVDPFSTLSAGLAKAYSREHKKHGLANGAWATVLPVAADRLGQHLLSGAPPELGRTVPEVPDKEYAGAVAGKAALALAQLGLSRLGNGWCPDSDTALQDLTAALVADAADGVLDGSGPMPDKESPGQLFVCGNPLSADTLRFDLAEAVHSWVAWTERKALAAELGRRSGMYDSLALDDGPLFGGLPGHLFDPLDPVFTLAQESPEAGSLICAPAKLRILVVDDHSMTEVVRLSPDPDAFPFQVALDRVEGKATVELDLNPDEAQGTSYPKAHFIFRAVDSVGNVTEFQASYRFDRDAPVFQSIAPDPEGCIPDAPATFTADVADAPSEEVQSVLIHLDGTEKPCLLREDGKWDCPADGFQDGTPVKLEARDACGTSTILEATGCLDAAPPVVEFSPPDGSWYSPANATGKVSVTDDKGVASVQVEGPLGNLECTSECTLDIPLPDSDSPPVTVSVTAVDVAGRETKASVLWKLDAGEPLLSVSSAQKIHPPALSVSLLVTVSDAESGVASVAVQGGGAEWTVAGSSGDDYVAVGKFEAVPLEGFMPLVLLAQDAAGNEASLNFAIWLDATPPEIEIIPTVFQDEAKATASYDQVTGEVEYDLSGTDPVSFDAGSCAVACPEFTRFASRLPDVDGVPVNLQNAPRLNLMVADDCAPAEFASQLTVIAAFYRGETLLNEVLYPAMGCEPMPTFVPFFLGMFTETPPAEFSFAEELLPNRLVVEVIDVAGNVASLDLDFVMHVRPPPLFVVDVPAPEWPSDTLAAACIPGTTDLHTLVESPAVLAAKKLVNPTPVAAIATLSQQPVEKVETLASRVYLSHDGACTGACPTGQCKLQAPPPADKPCGPASQYAPAPWWGGTLFAAVHAVPPLAETPNPLPEGIELQIPAGGEIRFDLRTRYGDEGFSLPAPVSVSAPDGAPASAYVLSDDTWLASCTWNAGLPPKPTCYDVAEVLAAFSSAPSKAALGLTVRTPAGTDEELQVLQTPWKPVVWVPDFALEYSPF